jgi:hypothetical protein
MFGMEMAAEGLRSFAANPFPILAAILGPGRARRTGRPDQRQPRPKGCDRCSGDPLKSLWDRVMVEKY